MKRRSLIRLALFELLSGLSLGQMSTLPAAKAIADLPGPAKNPPIFSEMTVILQGGLQYENAPGPKGPVASVDRIDEQLHRKSVLRFDESGRLISTVYEDQLGTSTTTNLWEKDKLTSQDVKHHRNTGGSADWVEWQQWSYDKGGRLSEFRAGRDKEEMNDYVNFRYDDSGRPLGYELYAQTVTEISYDGNKITLSRFDKYRHRKFFEQVQVVDDQRRVTDLKISDLSGGELKLWYHVTFRYDDKGRVIEQRTDPFKLGSGDDYSPLPGKLIVEYDDEKHVGEQKFYDTDDKLALHTKFGYDRDGMLTKLRVIDPSGKEVVGGETFVDAAHRSTTRPGSVEWEVIYDDQGNWTERRRWFTPADGGAKIMTRLIRQKITYR